VAIDQAAYEDEALQQI